MKKFFKEFKTFITRGNVMDMAVGVIVGGAFTAIVTALSDHILKPIINWVLALILGQNSLSEVFTYLKKVEVETEVNGVMVKTVDLSQSIYIDWGAFINAIINFILIAFVLFCIVKALNTLSDSGKNLKDMKLRIEYKQKKGRKLSKKEVQFLKAEEEREHAEAEQKAKEAEAARLLAEAEAAKPTTESLLLEIRDLLAKK